MTDLNYFGINNVTKERSPILRKLELEDLTKFPFIEITRNEVGLVKISGVYNYSNTERRKNQTYWGPNLSDEEVAKLIEVEITFSPDVDSTTVKTITQIMKDLAAIDFVFNTIRISYLKDGKPVFNDPSYITNTMVDKKAVIDKFNKTVNTILSTNETHGRSRAFVFSSATNQGFVPSSFVETVIKPQTRIKHWLLRFDLLDLWTLFDKSEALMKYFNNVHHLYLTVGIRPEWEQTNVIAVFARIFAGIRAARQNDTNLPTLKISIRSYYMGTKEYTNFMISKETLLDFGRHVQTTDVFATSTVKQTLYSFLKQVYRLDDPTRRVSNSGVFIVPSGTFVSITEAPSLVSLPLEIPSSPTPSVVENKRKEFSITRTAQQIVDMIRNQDWNHVLSCVEETRRTHILKEIASLNGRKILDLRKEQRDSFKEGFKKKYKVEFDPLVFQFLGPVVYAILGEKTDVNYATTLENYYKNELITETKQICRRHDIDDNVETRVKLINKNVRDRAEEIEIGYKNMKTEDVNFLVRTKYVKLFSRDTYGQLLIAMATYGLSSVQDVMYLLRFAPKKKTILDTLDNVRGELSEMVHLIIHSDLSYGVSNYTVHVQFNPIIEDVKHSKVNVEQMDKEIQDLNKTKILFYDITENGYVPKLLVWKGVDVSLYMSSILQGFMARCETEQEFIDYLTPIYKRYKENVGDDGQVYERVFIVAAKYISDILSLIKHYNDAKQQMIDNGQTFDIQSPEFLQLWGEQVELLSLAFGSSTMLVDELMKIGEKYDFDHDIYCDYLAHLTQGYDKDLRLIDQLAQQVGPDKIYATNFVNDLNEKLATFKTLAQTYKISMDDVLESILRVANISEQEQERHFEHWLDYVKRVQNELLEMYKEGQLILEDKKLEKVYTVFTYIQALDARESDYHMIKKNQPPVMFETETEREKRAQRARSDENLEMYLRKVNEEGKRFHFGGQTKYEKDGNYEIVRELLIELPANTVQEFWEKLNDFMTDQQLPTEKSDYEFFAHEYAEYSRLECIVYIQGFIEAQNELFLNDWTRLETNNPGIGKFVLGKYAKAENPKEAFMADIQLYIGGLSDQMDEQGNVYVDEVDFFKIMEWFIGERDHIDEKLKKFQQKYTKSLDTTLGSDLDTSSEDEEEEEAPKVGETRNKADDEEGTPNPKRQSGLTNSKKKYQNDD